MIPRPLPRQKFAVSSSSEKNECPPAENECPPAAVRTIQKLELRDGKLIVTNCVVKQLKLPVSPASSHEPKSLTLIKELSSSSNTDQTITTGNAREVQPSGMPLLPTSRLVDTNCQTVKPSSLRALAIRPRVNVAPVSASPGHVTHVTRVTLAPVSASLIPPVNQAASASRQTTPAKQALVFSAVPASTHMLSSPAPPASPPSPASSVPGAPPSKQAFSRLSASHSIPQPLRRLVSTAARAPLSSISPSCSSSSALTPLTSSPCQERAAGATASVPPHSAATAATTVVDNSSNSSSNSAHSRPPSSVLCGAFDHVRPASASAEPPRQPLRLYPVRIETTRLSTHPSKKVFFSPCYFYWT